jgi:putative lipoic acid-binding regulatory protein
MNSNVQSSLIEYPCDFPIKIMGRVDGLPVKPAVYRKREATPSYVPDNSVTAISADDGGQHFIQVVLMIVKRHAPDFDETSLEVKFSRKNTYLSLTCTVRAVSREQLDALYQELCDHPMVVMAL